MASRRVLTVATTGDDTTGDGSPEAPFRTPARARLVVAAAPGTVAEVRVLAGTYYLAAPVELDERDSHCTWRAVGEVRLHGGRRLRPQWRDWRDGILVADLDAPGVSEASGGLVFDQLFVNGERQVLARYPSTGYAADAVSAERAARWKDPTTALVRGLHHGEWGGNSFTVTGLDDEGAPQLHWVGDNNRGSGLHPAHRMVENVLEELDTPGEWFHDREDNLLYYLPPDELRPHLDEALIETAERSELLRVVGRDPRTPVRDLLVEGFTFSRTHRTLFTGEYEKLLLGDWAIVRSGAAYLRNTHHAVLRGCRFDQVGGNAVFLDGHHSGSAVEHSDFDRSGASDVAVVGRSEAVRAPSGWERQRTTPGDTEPGPRTEDYPRDITVRGNHLHAHGQFEKQVSGVQVSMARRVSIIENTVHGGPRAGVNIHDGTWGGHLIEHNDIFDCVRETSDHGPLNSWGRDRFWPLDADDASKRRHAFLDAVETTVVRHNRVHHTSDWCIDLDDGSSNYLIEDNLLIGGGVKLREGFCRTVRNNVFAGGAAHLHVWYADSGDIIERNVFAPAAGQPYHLIQVDTARSRPMIDHNLFHGAVPDEDWRAAGLDVNSLAADPQFTDPRRGDWTVPADSPARRIGFIPFRTDGFGAPDAPSAPLLPPAAGPEKPPERPRPTAEGNHPAATFLGARTSGLLSRALRSATGLGDSDGLYLAEVPPTSEAHRRGLRRNDVIRAVNDRRVTDPESFRTLLAHEGETDDDGTAAPLRLTVWRDQRATELHITPPAPGA